MAKLNSPFQVTVDPYLPLAEHLDNDFANSIWQYVQVHKYLHASYEFYDSPWKRIRSKELQI